MKISGGTTFGNCATGNPARVTRPTMTVMMEITMATIGRSMKNFDIRLIPRFRCARIDGHRRDKIGGGNEGSFADFLEAFDDQALSGLKPLFNDPKITGPLADLNGLNVDFVFRVNDGDL